MKKFIATALTALIMATPVMANGITVYSNCNQVADKGVIIEGRTMVPVRGVFEYMGYQVEWDSATKTALLKNDKTTIMLINGAPSFYVNGKTITPDVPHQIVNGRFMLPLRAVGEALNAQVDWDSANKIAYVTQEEYLEELAKLMNNDTVQVTTKATTEETTEVVTEETTEATTEAVSEETTIKINEDKINLIPGLSVEIMDINGNNDEIDYVTDIVIE